MARILIVDDHPITRDGLAMRIDRETDLEVCGEADDIDEALQTVAKTNPDLAVIDVSLKSGNGIELVKEIKYRFPNVRMLVWSMYDESIYADRALKAGASGYINKQSVRENIIDAIKMVLGGGVYLSANHTAKIINRLDRGGKPVLNTKSPMEVLSDRELETFSLIGHGKKTAEIATQMNVTTKTIETYRTRIKEKLDLEHAGELSRLAIQWVLENG